MTTRKYTASSSREAMRLVKQDLGAEALILSSRAVPGGVEVLALPAAEAASIAPAGAPAASAAASAVVPAARDPRVSELAGELASMRGMLDERLASLAWNELQKREPVRAALMRDLLRAGFSAALGRHLLERLAAGSDHARGAEWMRAVLAHNLHVAQEEIVERGGAYAIVGPTGVGKTTTAAKLAARCVMRHGADKLALLTTDSYRVGGHEQLRIYGRILGAPVHAVKDSADLALLLGEFKHKHLVLIDTIGISQRDKQVVEQATLLAEAGAPIRRLLLLNATCSGATLEDVVHAYRPLGIDGCVITKTDEAASLGGALDCVIRHRLVLHAIANGQRVPEDLSAPHPRALVDSAFSDAAAPSPFALRGEEASLLFPSAPGASAFARAAP